MVIKGIIVNIYAKSDRAILREIGARIKRRRLSQNITQQVLAEKTGLNRMTIVQLEKGDSCTMMTFIQVLRGLEALGELENFLPEPGIRPLQLIEMQGKVRRRASTKLKPPEKGETEW
ncbi:helix-turn-helix domain-containing protein [candidate division KSB1 bacterium]|nr:helix-turn-helix domain-containing protein [candidate division KSB1 bacterium]